jgi:hypothetical protein
MFISKHRHSPEHEALCKIEERAELMGISIIRVMPIENDDTTYCILEAPDANAVAAFHSLAGIKCDEIQEVLYVEEFPLQEEEAELTIRK